MAGAVCVGGSIAQPSRRVKKYFERLLLKSLAWGASLATSWGLEAGSLPHERRNVSEGCPRERRARKARGGEIHAYATVGGGGVAGKRRL